MCELFCHCHNLCFNLFSLCCVCVSCRSAFKLLAPSPGPNVSRFTGALNRTRPLEFHKDFPRSAATSSNLITMASNPRAMASNTSPSFSILLVSSSKSRRPCLPCLPLELHPVGSAIGSVARSAGASARGGAPRPALGHRWRSDIFVLWHFTEIDRFPRSQGGVKI